jgi:multisubunit Na+/H+ antiporter MnhC subunit
MCKNGDIGGMDDNKSPLLALWCLMLDLAIIVAHSVTNGRYPSLTKVIACTVITVSINAYCFWTAKKHREWRAALRLASKAGLRPAITIRQAVIVVAAIIGFSVLGTWALFTDHILS